MSTVKNKKIKEVLRCPICKCGMDIDERENGILFCNGERRHCYDFGAGGYVNLTKPGQSNGGDSKGAVRARSAFLDTQHYSPIAHKLCELVEKYCGAESLVIDAGCGEGYYSVEIAKRGYSVIGFDLSKFATDAAAKRAKGEVADNTFFGTASVFDMPVANKAADAVVNIFAPCAEDEYSRVLKDGGVLIAVYAGPEHLMGLKNAIYEKTHANEERADLPKAMDEIECQRLTYTINVQGNASVKNLFAMTPYYWRTSIEDVKKLESVEELSTTVDIIFTVYNK